MNLSDKTFEKIIVLNQIKPSFPIHEPNETIVKLHGHEINLGYKKIEILDAYISNLEALRDKKENLATFRSKSQTVTISYTKEPVVA